MNGKELISKMHELYNIEYTIVNVEGNVNNIKADNYVTVKCENGHIWRTRLSRLITSKLELGCPECSKTLALSKRQCEVEKEIISTSNGNIAMVDRTEYTANKVDITLKCMKCNNVFKRNYSNFTKTNLCPFCEGKIQNTEQLKYRAKMVAGDEYSILGEFKSAKSKIRIYHESCKKEFAMSPDHFIRGQRCTHCSHGHKLKTQEEFEKEVFDKYGDEYIVVGEYTGNKNTISIKHECGRIIIPIAVEFIKDFGIECPCKRNKSKGEREVARVLTEMSIPYEEEFTFDDCKDKSLLRFDFKIEVEGKMILIEFDGIYHFRPVNGDIETFEGQRRRDSIKDKYCIDNDIELIRIKCTDIDKVSDILADKLK